MNLIPKSTRIHRFLNKLLHTTPYQWDDIPDPRHKRGRRWTIQALLNTMLLGMLAGFRALAALEAFTEDHWACSLLNLPRRLPDTTLYNFIRRLDPRPLRDKLVAQVRFHYRRKRYQPQALPCGVVSIDGKCIGVLPHDAQGQAQPQLNDGKERYLLRVLRAVLTSSPLRPCIDQEVIPPHTNDMGAFPPFFNALLEQYGSLDMFEIVTLDAGFCSLENATLIHQHNRAYLFSLKKNQPDLLAEAQRVLKPLLGQKPHAETPWEKAHGKLTRRKLYRSQEMAAFLDWNHLRQVWLVVQETRDNRGNRKVEERYFITNLPWRRLSPQQCLLVVRGHWGVENDCNWVYDTQWLEDDMPWCTQGNALVVLGLLRTMAYNLINILRKRHLVPRQSVRSQQRPCPFRLLFRWVKEAMALHWPLEITPTRVD